MRWLTQLADVARRTGHPVIEVPGWRTRGHGPQPAVEGIVCHHTAGWNDLHVVRDGRPGLSGPLSQIWLRRDGTIFVVAAGRCWQNAPSTSALHDNSSAIGIEAENDGRAPWPARQLDAYRKLCAELCREFGLSAARVKGHKEVNRSKSDPHSIDMDVWRADIAHLIAGEDDDVSAKDVWTHEIKVPFGKPGNEEWQARNVLTNTANWVYEMRRTVAELGAKLDAQNATIKAMADALATRDTEIDVEALMDRIRGELERVTVRLDVAEVVERSSEP